MSQRLMNHGSRLHSQEMCVCKKPMYSKHTHTHTHTHTHIGYIHMPISIMFNFPLFYFDTLFYVLSVFSVIVFSNNLNAKYDLAIYADNHANKAL